MVAADADPRSLPPTPWPGSIRNAEPRDHAEIARLLAAAEIDARTIETAQRRPLRRCHRLVLDIEGVVRAIIHVVVNVEHGICGRLQLLVIDPALARRFGRAVEDRMVGVAVALCEAYGCTEIERAATPQNDVAGRREVRAACAGG